MFEPQGFDQFIALFETLAPYFTALVIVAVGAYWGNRYKEVVEKELEVLRVQNETLQHQVSFVQSLLSPDLKAAFESMQTNADERVQVLEEQGADPERVKAVKGFRDSLATTSDNLGVLREKYPEEVLNVTGTVQGLGDEFENLNSTWRKAFTEEGELYFLPVKPAENGDEESQ